MLQPSYTELMEKLNHNGTDEDKPIITSRYSIVIATAKRARQIVEEGKPLVNAKVNKPVSIAVEELYRGKVIIKNKANQDYGIQNNDTLNNDDVQNYNVDPDSPEDSSEE